MPVKVIMGGAYNPMKVIRIPFTADSAGQPFDLVAAGAPVTVENLRFALINETPFDVRFLEQMDPAQYVPVTHSVGYSIMARTDKGPFASRRGLVASVQAFSTPGNPFDATADFTGCFLEVAYSR